jgi:hypothetical protein
MKSIINWKLKIQLKSFIQKLFIYPTKKRLSKNHFSNSLYNQQLFYKTYCFTILTVFDWLFSVVIFIRYTPLALLLKFNKVAPELIFLL